MSGSQRSQSEVVGVVLLTAVIVVVVSVSGLFILSNTTTDPAPKISFDAEATTQNVTVFHSGGDTIPTDELDIILRASSREAYPLSTFTQSIGSDGTVFEPGDEWFRSHGIDGDRMEILVVHRPSNEVIADLEIEIEESLAARFEYTPSNPTTLDTVSFDGTESVAQDGTIQSYTWNFGDGTTATGETPTHSYDAAGEYDVNLTVETDDGRTATVVETVTVSNPTPTASFTFEPLDPDRTIEFDASGSEPGDPTGGTVENYTWEFDDGTTATKEVLNHTYDSQAVYLVSLTVEDDNGETDTTSQLVGVYNNFLVSNFSAPETAGQDETITVEATIENTGTETTTQTIEYQFNGTVENSTAVTLGYQERTNVSLTYTIPSDQKTGVYDHGIYSANDSATDQLEVTDASTNPAYFDVSIDSTDTEVIAGEEITVDYTVTNTGDLADTQDILFSVDGTVLESPTVQLNGSETTSGSFTYATSKGDIPAVDVRIDSDDNAATRQVDVEPRIRIFNARVDGGSSSEVRFDVRNEGESTVSIADITINSTNTTATRVNDPGGEELNFTGGGSLSLDSNDGIEIGNRAYPLNTSESVSGSGRTTGELVEFEDPDRSGKKDVDMSGKNVTMTLFLDNGERYTETLTVADRPFFAVDITETNSPVERGDTLNVTVLTENVGQVADTQDIQLEFNGTTVGDPLQLQLDPGNSSKNTLSYDIPADQEPGEYGVRAVSDDDTDSTTVDVIEQGAPFFEVDLLEEQSTLTVVEGENASVVAEITNAGNQTDTQNVSLDIDGSGVVDQVTDLTINDSETKQVTLEWTTGATGTYTATVTTEDDENSTTISVVEANTFTKLDVTAIDAGTQGDKPNSIELEYELSSESNVTFRAEEDGGNTGEVGKNSTTSGNVTIEISSGSNKGKGNNDFPVEIEADITENECLRTTVESDTDTKSLDDWSPC